jgi:hypothetical protein
MDPDAAPTGPEAKAAYRQMQEIIERYTSP